jgi:hypothetical protein
MHTHTRTHTHAGTRTLAVLTQGAFFGELSLLLNNVRNATVSTHPRTRSCTRTRTHTRTHTKVLADTTPERLTKLYRLDASVLDAVIAMFPTQQAIMRGHRRRAVGPVLRLATQSAHGIHTIEGSAEVQAEAERIAAMFGTMDVDGAGVISAYQLHPLMEKLGLHMPLEEVHVVCLDFDDGDKGGELTLEEFSRLMSTPYRPYGASNADEAQGDAAEGNQNAGGATAMPTLEAGMQVWHGKRGAGVIHGVDPATPAPFTVHFETGEVLKYTQAKMATLALVKPKPASTATAVRAVTP